MEKKWMVILFIGLLFITGFSGGITADQSIGIIVDGRPLKLDESPTLTNDRVLVPQRTIFEALGASISWDPSTKTVLATSQNHSVKLTVGETVAYINNQVIKLDVPPKIVDGRTMIPLRFISQALDAKVTWSQDARLVIVTHTSTEAEIKSIDQVKRYLALYQQAIRETVKHEQWEGILSALAIHGGKVAQPTYHDVDPESSITNIEIVRSKLIRQNSNTVCEVTAHYTHLDATKENKWNEIEYEKVYTLIMEGEKWVLNDERVEKMRVFPSFPLVSFNEPELINYEAAWKENNWYSYTKMQQINLEHFNPILQKIALYTVREDWVDPSDDEKSDKAEDEFEKLVSSLSLGHELDKLLEIKPKRDPVFGIISATSDENNITAQILGDYFPGFDFMPVMFEIEMKKSKDGNWTLTNITKVKSYKDLVEFQENDPTDFKFHSKVYNYRIEQGLWNN
jgi:hypothetical protein